jgi:hypothetical protein
MPWSSGPNCPCSWKADAACCEQRWRAPEEKHEKFGNTTVFGRPGQRAELASIMFSSPRLANFATGNIYGSGGGQGQP